MHWLCMLTFLKMFSGPTSESVPTATSGFMHRRSRADSTASFQFYDDDDDDFDAEDWPEEAVLDEQDELERGDSSKTSLGWLGYQWFPGWRKNESKDIYSD